MSLKIAADNSPPLPVTGEVVVREYNEQRDKSAVDAMERQMEVGSSLVTDLMGDPICRIRHVPLHVMLVAEFGEEKEIVGVIRASIKTMTKGNPTEFIKMAYILGLRVSPFHRRLGIGMKLVKKIEEWCKQNGAKYAYMATECANKPSINLFTKKCCYTKFRTPTMLVQPVHAHYKSISSSVSIVRLTPPLAEAIYRKVFASAEFFPKDIDVILSNTLNLGTFMAMPKNLYTKWDPNKGDLPSHFAILSVWNLKEVFKLQVKGVSKLTYACCFGSRLLDSWFPWLRLPSIPNVFRQFGVYFLYGLHREGSHGPRLMKALCGFAHNMGRDDEGCGAVVTEVSPLDPVRNAVPHWRKFSWEEDVWCIKKLEDGKSDYWITTGPKSNVIFVDPRDT